MKSVKLIQLNMKGACQANSGNYGSAISGPGPLKSVGHCRRITTSLVTNGVSCVIAIAGSGAAGGRARGERDHIDVGYEGLELRLRDS